MWTSLYAVRKKRKKLMHSKNMKAVIFLNHWVGNDFAILTPSNTIIFEKSLIKLVRHQQEHFDSEWHGYLRVGNHAVASFWGPSLTVSKLAALGSMESSGSKLRTPIQQCRPKKKKKIKKCLICFELYSLTMMLQSLTGTHIIRRMFSHEITMDLSDIKSISLKK